MPVGSKEVPLWVSHVGCEIACEGRSFKYLGIRTGVDLANGENIQEALRRLNRRMLQWENFYLPWSARIVLIKHVLTQIIMMAVGAWGLQMRFISGILDGRETEWAHIARRMMCISFLTGLGKRERSCWSSGMGLLLLANLPMKEAPTLDRLLRVWFVIKISIKFSGLEGKLPGTLPVTSLKRLWELMDKSRAEGFKLIEREARKLKVIQLRDFSSGNAGFKIQQLVQGCSVVEQQSPELISITLWLENIQLVNCDLQQLAGWYWVNGKEVKTSWSLPNREWTRMLGCQEQVDVKFCRHWVEEYCPMKWSLRWRLLWTGKAPMGHRVWLWRILQQGLPTLERAKLWGVAPGVCQWCGPTPLTYSRSKGQKVKSIDHLLWNCSRVRQRVLWLYETFQVQEYTSPTFFQTLDHCLELHNTQPGALILLSEHCKVSWKECNMSLFEDRKEIVSPWLVLSAAKNSMQAGWNRLQSEQADRIRRKDEGLINRTQDVLKIITLNTSGFKLSFEKRGMCPTLGHHDI
ncbi:hypothetical protein R1sor_014021 [Riccia sorocarpa]|uniref:Reverse transcriptase zinc-binding domain-containing protein n=1 Tax=Riccia sorocarpa TaxID=122646 RepID=A0ABD3HAT9_9MARC